MPINLLKLEMIDMNNGDGQVCRQSRNALSFGLLTKFTIYGAFFKSSRYKIKNIVGSTFLIQWKKKATYSGKFPCDFYQIEKSVIALFKAFTIKNVCRQKRI